MKHFLEIVSRYQPLLEVGGLLFGGLGAIWAIWWKFSQSYAKTSMEFASMKKQISKSDSLTLDMTKALVQLATKLDEREKDIAKLEGAMDVQRRDMMEVIKGLQAAVSSLDGMWRTLQTIHPDKVPRRASDRV